MCVCVSACSPNNALWEYSRSHSNNQIVIFIVGTNVCDCVCASFEDVNFILCHIFPIAVQSWQPWYDALF